MTHLLNTNAMNAAANVSAFLLDGKDPGRIALRTIDADYTYGDLVFALDEIAEYLVNAGARKGDRAILLGENSFFWVAAYLGILRAGLVCVPLPSGISKPGLGYILDATEARFAFLQGRSAFKHGAEMPGIDVVTEREVSGMLAARSIATPGDLRSEDPTARTPFPEVNSRDLAALMFTSGSTGRPRGVMVSHGNIIANTNSIIECLKLGENDSVMTVLPFHYCFGISLLHTHLKAGGSLVLDSRFMYPEVVLQRLQETACSGFAGVPSHYQILLRSSTLKRKSFPHLRWVQQAGGHLAPSFVRELREALPNARIFVMYGQTEATARLACLPPERLESKAGSIGKAIPGVTLRVLNESGEAVKPGEIGEIVAEGENVAQGYWRASEDSATTFREGRLYTGDLATVDDEEFIYVVDRAKEFVKCGGKRVSCRQLEDTLLEFDGLLETAVVGIPDDVLGEAVKAFVVPRQQGADGLEDHLRLFCKAHLPHQLIPREIVVMRSLPKNSSGKVLRAQLKTIPDVTPIGNMGRTPAVTVARGLEPNTLQEG